MTNDTGLTQACDRDRGVWDQCAAAYERNIVHGHPDVVAYEAFEEEFLDRVLAFLAERSGKPLHVIDVGCGSGRLHLRYGLKTTRGDQLPAADAENLARARASRRDLDYDPVLAGETGGGIELIGGIDLSSELINLAAGKLGEAGLGTLLGQRLWLRQGSAFDLEPLDPEPLPVLVTVCNSIGVMQGPEGAQQLFKSLRRAAETASGIAVISAYRKEAVQSHALGNYESTMNVSGQPRWLAPQTYARNNGFTLVPRRYKRAWDSSKSILVDVFDRNGQKVCDGFLLTRVNDEVERTIETGHIRTWSRYESYWYGFDTIARWIDAYWGRDTSWHLAGIELDALRAAPAQIAVYDPQRRLADLFGRWRISTREA
ncbi:MAG TPA: hypothetical protein VMZ06_08020 [Candidatus Bathyarchaeia archaeon]|nr:hypothetical protein [Candidatus Bathyarchaeia archaeon]